MRFTIVTYDPETGYRVKTQHDTSIQALQTAQKHNASAPGYGIFDAQYKRWHYYKGTFPCATRN